MTVDVTAVLRKQADTGNTWRFYADCADNKAAGLTVGNGTLTFDTNGKLKASTGTNIIVDRPAPARARHWRSSLISADDSSPGSRSTLVMSHAGWLPAGTLNSFSVGERRDHHRRLQQRPDPHTGAGGARHVHQPQGLVDKGGNIVRCRREQRQSRSSLTPWQSGPVRSELGRWSRATSICPRSSPT